MSPDQSAAPTVYVVIERDCYPDSVWWTHAEAEARRVALRQENVGAYHAVVEYRMSDPEFEGDFFESDVYQEATT